MLCPNGKDHVLGKKQGCKSCEEYEKHVKRAEGIINFFFRLLHKERSKRIK